MLDVNNERYIPTLYQCYRKMKNLRFDDVDERRKTKTKTKDENEDERRKTSIEKEQ